MLDLRFVVSLFFVGAMLLHVGVVSGQDYPNKPIRMITSAAGGGNDFVARVPAQGLTVNLGQQVVVDNRGSGAAPGLAVKQAAPDGYTMLVASNSFMLGHLLQPTPYNSVTDFAPIAGVATSPSILVIPSSLPVKSVKELIALAKAKPGVLNYASASIGSSNHLAAELFKSLAGVNIVRINYKGATAAITALVSGEEVQLMFASIASGMPHVKSGRLMALAVTSAQPSALVPGVPTVASSGQPGYELSSTDSVFAPVKTPTVIINRLNQELVRVINRPDVKQKFFDAGIETVGYSPQELAALVKTQVATMGKVIKDAGIRIE